LRDLLWQAWSMCPASAPRGRTRRLIWPKWARSILALAEMGQRRDTSLRSPLEEEPLGTLTTPRPLVPLL